MRKIIICLALLWLALIVTKISDDLFHLRLAYEVVHGLPISPGTPTPSQNPTP